MKIVADTNIPFVKECFSSIVDVRVISGRDMTAKVVSDADILLVRSITKVNAELLGKSSVRFVATATIGTDHIDTDYLNSRNIGFASAPGSNATQPSGRVTAKPYSAISTRPPIHGGGEASSARVDPNAVASRQTRSSVTLASRRILVPVRMPPSSAPHSHGQEPDGPAACGAMAATTRPNPLYMAVS